MCNFLWEGGGRFRYIKIKREIQGEKKSCFPDKTSILDRWHLYTNTKCRALGLVTSGSVVTLFITVFKRISDDMENKI